MTDILNINDLCVNLQGKNILSGIQLSLAKGNILGLVGPSGCGKTTLLNTIAGFIEQSKGEIVIDENIVITPESIVAPQHRTIGMIFQDYALFPHLSVEKNILFGISKLAKSDQKSRLNQLLSLLELNDLEKRFPHQLSGGQQQRVAIARALAPQPKVLLLDEPFSNIDARLRSELMQTMRQLLKSLQMTAIFVTHNKDEVFTFADKIAVMHQGQILQTDEPAKVCQQPNSWQVADFLQLGSWVPLKTTSNDECLTAIGNFHLTDEDIKQTRYSENCQHYLLLKPQHIILASAGNANVRIEYISVTEQGYHYTFSSLSDSNELSFQKLSYYCNDIFSVGQELSIEIEPHSFIIFENIKSSIYS